MKIGIDMFFKNFSKIDFLIFGSLASIVVASITVDTVLDVAAYNKDKNWENYLHCIITSFLCFLYLHPLYS